MKTSKGQEGREAAKAAKAAKTAKTAPSEGDSGYTEHFIAAVTNEGVGSEEVWDEAAQTVNYYLEKARKGESKEAESENRALEYRVSENAAHITRR